MLEVNSIDLQLFAEDSEGTGDQPGDNPPAEPSGKTYTEEEFRAEIEKLSKQYEQQMTEKLEAAKKEAEQLAKMNQEEKKQFELEKRLKEIEEREKALFMRELRTETIKMVAKEGLPEDVVDLVLAGDQEITKKNLERFKKVFDAAVQAAVEARLKGKTPSAGTGNTGQKTPSIREQFAKALRGV